ncbi:FecR family protein [Chitinophaga japonensis]|uniref:FecR family protein n=1 Tax=Chitinophaga japonensis TaxID=104662 RepID=A0A562TEX4_CHIJA|nr:FecR domain-containing protein [Chitinophaga japonensis]TWI92035.1 FecR family protein [Chitinophaga japonensis]
MELPKDYEHYSTDDFIADDRFLQWVRFPDAESDACWRQWIAAHPHKKEQTDEARAFIEGLHFKETLPTAAAVEAALARNLAMIAGLEQEPAAPVKVRRLRKAGRWAAAAVVLGFLAMAGRQLWQQQSRMVQYTGLADGVRRVWLPDSSEVILNANAEISFRDNWQQADRREVWLKGEAFFDIRPAAAGAHLARAFVVHSANMEIDVLGTSFNVKEGQAFTNITLNTGKIKIRFSDLPETPLYLSPGDFVQYSAKKNKIVRKRVNADLYAVWKEEGRQLEHVTLKEMAAYIEDIYGYHVKISSRELAQAQLSGGLRVKDEKLLLETLSFALNITIEKKADTLFIQPKK